MAEENKKNVQILFPDQLVSPVDLSRVLRELTALDDSLYQANIREPGQSVKLARSSATLEELARINNASLLDPEHRKRIIEILKVLREHAPKIHISFAVEPSAAFTREVTAWLRRNIHELMLLDVGLQPTLAAGCMVRTDNKVFDMSLRHRFEESRHLLYETIAASKDPTPEVAAEASDVPVPAEGAKS